MSDLDKAMRRYMEYLVHEEGRSFSYRDFMRFEVDGIEHKMTHQTFRNKISQLRRGGIIELSYNCGTAYYSLKDKKFGKPMTPTHTGGQSCHPIVKVIRSLPFDRAALHNIRLLFEARGCWNLLAESGAYELQPNSKDIRLPLVPDGDIRLRPTVHRTDKISVDVGCSGSPIAADIGGLIRLSKALVRVEERLFRWLQDCKGPPSAASMPAVIIVIPESSSWTVTMWHFGRDSVNTYKGKQFEATWEIGQKELLRVYSKEFPGIVRGRSKTKLRVEMQQYPSSTVEQIIDSLYTNSNSGLDWIGGGDR